MTTLPIRPVTLPAVLKGQPNGKLPDSILVNVPCLYGGPTVRLVQLAARAWKAMCGAAAKAGHKLKCSGTYDSYRPYEQQVKVFLARFSTTNTGTGVTRTWQGRTYWLKPGVALAAVPGTSNHGLGLAVDTGVELDGDAGTESVDAATLAWLVAHEHLYGFSHEVQSEPWHIRYTTGDAIPAAVLAHQGDEDMTPDEREHLIQLAYRLHAVMHDLPATVGGPITGERNDLHFLLADVATRLTTLEAKPAATVDVNALAAKLATDPAFAAAVAAPTVAKVDALTALVEKLIASEKAQAKALGE